MSGARMVDVGDKPLVRRRAVASGRLHLKPATLSAIRRRRLEKGDALEIARTAAILAVKNTPQVLPLCHPIPLESADVQFEFGARTLTCRVTCQATWKTGVEMEALVGAATALLTVWDIVKPLEKDPRGQYPGTRLTDLRVEAKVKSR